MTEQQVGLFDLDGTLCDYIGQLRRDLERLCSPGEILPDNLYDNTPPWLLARIDLVKRQPGWWRDLPKLWAGWHVLRAAQAIGFEIEVLTKGPTGNSQVWAEKVAWINSNLWEGAVINIVSNRKSRYYGRFLCEDYPEYLADWLQYRPRGLGILIENEFNKDFEHPNVIHYKENIDGLEVIKKHLKAVYVRPNGIHWRQYL